MPGTIGGDGANEITIDAENTYEVTIDGDVAFVLDTDIPSGVVSHWRASYGAGSNVIDDRGGRDITLNHSNWVADGRSLDGYYLPFNGSGDSGTAPNDGTFSGMNDFTVFTALNVNTYPSGSMEILSSYRTSDNNRSWRLYWYNGAWWINLSRDGSTYAGIGPAGGQEDGWFTLAVTRDSSTGDVTFYINAEPIYTENSWTDTLYDNGLDMTVANSYHTSAYLDGDMDNIAFADEALSQSEIQQLHDMVPRFQGLVAADTALTRPADNRDNPGGYTGYAGFRITANRDMEGLRLIVSEDTQDVGVAEVLQPDGTIIAQKNLDNVSAGHEFDIEAEIVGGNYYHVVLGPQEGGSYTRGAYGMSTAEWDAAENDYVNVTHGAYSSTSTSSSWWYTMNSVAPLRLPYGTTSYSVSDPYYLDMTDSSARVDYSSHGITFEPGMSFLTTMAVSQLGSSGHRMYPGLFNGSGGGDWDNYATLVLGDNETNPTTSGSAQVGFRVEESTGSTAYSETASISINTWTVLGFIWHDDGTWTWYIDREEVGSATDNTVSTDFIDFSYFGSGYGGASNNGGGAKYMDHMFLYDRELNTDEIQNYQDSINESGYGFEAPAKPIHGYLFDEGSGSTIGDSDTNADGTATGTYSWTAGGQP